MDQQVLFSSDALEFWRDAITDILVLGFLWALLWYFLPYLLRAIRIWRASSALGSWPRSGPMRYRAPTALSFGGQVPLLRNPLVRTWDRFIDAWRQGAASEDVAGSALPEMFFTEEAVLGVKSRAIPEALPGLFAGFGLLGTFIGIAVGLSGINLSSTDPSLLMNSVGVLVSGMSTAFQTSIYGIGLSLAWVVVFRFARHQLHLSLLRFNYAAEKAFPYEDPQTTLLNIARSSQQSQEYLRSFGQDIHEALEEALKATVSPALEGVSDAVGALATQLQDREFEGMEKIVQSFRESLSESLDEDIGRFSTALRAAADQQAQTVDRMDQFFARIEEVSDSQTRLLDRTAEVSTAFHDGLGSLEGAQVAIGETSNSVLRLMEESALLSSEARAQAETFREANAALQESLASQLDTTQQHVQGVFEFWEHFESRLERMTTELTQSLGELTTFTAQKIGEVFHSFDQEMATVVEHLAGTLSELRSVTEDLPTITQRLATSIAELPPALTEASANFAGLASQAEESRTQATQDLERLGQEIERLAVGSVQSLSTLNDSLPDVTRRSGELAAVFQETNAQLGQLRAELEKLRTSRPRGFLGTFRGT